MTKSSKKKPKVENGKVRKNFRLPADLALWADRYARRRNTNLTQLIVDQLTVLREEQQ